MMNNKKKKTKWGQICLNIFFIIVSLSYILPLILMISISVSSEAAIAKYGYSLFPRDLGLDGYKAVLSNPKQLIDSYKVTIIYSVVATVLSMLIKALAAYPLSRSNYRLKKPVTMFMFFTMLFSGGMVPMYLLNTKYLHLNNTIWIYIVPGLVAAWDIFIMRTFFQGLPDGLVEAAKIDGASEVRIFFQMILPLSTPVLASLGFMYMIGKWNDWNTSMLYIQKNELFSLQYLLQRILREAEYLKSLAKSGAMIMTDQEPPTETMRYAMAILAAGPMMVIFPFFQKYFAAGLTIGSVKG